MMVLQAFVIRHFRELCMCMLWEECADVRTSTGYEFVFVTHCKAWLQHIVAWSQVMQACFCHIRSKDNAMQRMLQTSSRTHFCDTCKQVRNNMEKQVVM